MADFPEEGEYLIKAVITDVDCYADIIDGEDVLRGLPVADTFWQLKYTRDQEGVERFCTFSQGYGVNTRYLGLLYGVENNAPVFRTYAPYEWRLERTWFKPHYFIYQVALEKKYAWYADKSGPAVVIDYVEEHARVWEFLPRTE